MKVKIAAAFATVTLLSATYSAHDASASIIHTVKKGDSLSKIANTYKTNVNELKLANGLRSDMIYINQKITIPAPVANRQLTVPKLALPSKAVSSPTYTVARGDSLSKIAAAKKTTVANLKTWNNLKSDRIFIGQKLIVAAPAVPAAPNPAPAPQKPAAAPIISKPAPAAQKPAPVPAPTVQKPSAPATPATTTYIVKRGDTLSKISLQFKTTVKAIKDLNKLSSDMIRVGQALKIPAAASPAAPPVAKAPASPAPAPAPVPASVPDGEAALAVSKANELLGTPYLWGGSTPQGFDCSGFIYYVENQAGNKMERYSSQGYYDRSYYVDKPEPGDLVFFENTYKQGISHMGIYIGDNQFIHASEKGVVITSLNDPYYKAHFESFKRFY